MRKILIDTALAEKIKHFCDTLFVNRNFNVLNSLRGINMRGEKFQPQKSQYILKIINEYDRIKSADLNEMSQLIQEFDQIINQSRLSKDFKKKIVVAMHYEALREKEYLEIMQELDIKSCLYCNAQLTLVIETKNNGGRGNAGQITREGKLELDHYYPKSKYPFLCTSFYNLIPCCSNCNRSKSDLESSYYPYTSNPQEVDCFRFRLDENSMDEYWKTNDKSKLFINFESDNLALRTNHNDFFRIEEIYATQKDVAEEIIQKTKAYTEDYKKYLVSNFKDLFPDNALVNRLLVGNYTKPEEIHKRPLAKFMQDIARQVGLISS
jgi:hypothetical protein